jgi:hypothetical protein
VESGQVKRSEPWSVSRLANVSPAGPLSGLTRQQPPTGQWCLVAVMPGE